MSRFSGVLTAAFLLAAMPFARVFVVMAADDPPPPQSAAPAAPSSRAADQPPLITKNSDGTFTIQKVPPKGSKDNDMGLIIPPQVVVPFVLLPQKTQKPSPPQNSQ